MESKSWLLKLSSADSGDQGAKSSSGERAGVQKVLC